MQKAFTMAEILLSLTIIGVVAAITLPSLTGNINERTWNTQRKALYARFSQALALMPSLNGYGTLTEESAPDAGDAVDTAAETFVTSGLAKVMKINNICDNEHLEDCGIPTTITNITGSTLSSFTTSYNTLVGFNSLFTSSAGVKLDTKAAAFETANGESILVYYNPNCAPNLGETGNHYIQPKMCANFVYDLNGNKGPNTVGKDIGFISAIYSTDPVVVAPLPLAINGNPGEQTQGNENCKNQDRESRLPNRDELSAIFYNSLLLGIDFFHGYWSSSIILSGKNGTAWDVDFINGLRRPVSRDKRAYIRCVKR